MIKSTFVNVKIFFRALQIKRIFDGFYIPKCKKVFVNHIAKMSKNVRVDTGTVLCYVQSVEVYKPLSVERLAVFLYPKISERS